MDAATRQLHWASLLPVSGSCTHCTLHLVNVLHHLPSLVQSSLLSLFLCVPGLVVIPDPFLAGHQHHWVRRCLVDYPCRPNVCNLDAHVKREGEGQLWPEGDKGTLQLRKEDLLYKLRWVTLGYHYDWNTKVRTMLCACILSGHRVEVSGAGSLLAGVL